MQSVIHKEIRQVGQLGHQERGQEGVCPKEKQFKNIHPETAKNNINIAKKHKKKFRIPIWGLTRISLGRLQGCFTSRELIQ